LTTKSQIRFKGKAQADEKAQSRQRRDEQYILKRFATQLMDLRWDFDTTSGVYQKIDSESMPLFFSLDISGHP
jgi:hypothetical protein